MGHEAAGEPCGGEGFPPAGWVRRDEAMGILRVRLDRFSGLAAAGRMPFGKVVPRRPKGRCKIYPVAELERLRDRLAEERIAADAEAEANRGRLPEGFVDRHGACERLGIGTATLNLWARQGRLRYSGEFVEVPGRGRCRVYEVAALLRAREAMKAAEALCGETGDAGLPEGWVDMAGAAALFGVSHVGTLTKWQQEGRLPRGRWHTRGAGLGRVYGFEVAELERVKAAREAEAARPVAPEGFVELDEAARRLGVGVGTIGKWERRGRIAQGRVVPIPGTSARTKVYPVEEIERLGEAIRRAKEAFPPAGWVDMKEAARRAGVSVEVWKRWLAEGRVERWRWAERPTLARCKLFCVEEIDRLVAEAGRDHLFFLEPDGRGGWVAPAGYVDRAGAAAILGVSPHTVKHWQSEGRITCGRWARVRPEQAGIGVNGRRVYAVEGLRRLAAELETVGKPYVDPADPAVARVPIMSWSETRFEAVIDASDLPLIEGMRWNWMPRSTGEDAVVVRSASSGEQVPLRRVLLGVKGHRWKVSHRNGDPLDCRRANLVVRDPSDHLGHARKRKVGYGGGPPTSRFKGVCWVERDGAWRATIRKDGVTRRLGKFDDELAAAEAYDEAARELFGEHARLNFPDGVAAALARKMAAAIPQGDAGADAEEPFDEHERFRSAA